MMSNEDQQAGVSEERRQFFRVDDNVTLSFRQIPEDEPSYQPGMPGRESESNFELVSSLAEISHQMTEMLSSIETDRPVVANYLKSLDRKVDVLGRAFLAYASDLFGEPASPVSLSASGIAFHVSEPLQPGANLEMKLLLMPSFIGILAFGKVVSCDQAATAESGTIYLLRVGFTDMRESDRGHLMRYIIHRKSVQLRQQREVRESGS